MSKILYESVCLSIYESEFNKNHALAYDLKMSELKINIENELKKRGWTPTKLAEVSGENQLTVLS